MTKVQQPTTTPHAQRAWWDQVDWWTDPRLAYARGLADGYQQGRDAADAELVQALARALGGPDCSNYQEGVTRHLRAVAQKMRRAVADREDVAA